MRKAKAYSLFPALRRYGIWNILRSRDLYVAFLVAFAFVLFIYVGQSSDAVTGEVASLLATSVALSGAILGLILASFAIIMGFSEPKFTLFLRRSEDALSDVVALFWYVGLLAASAASVGLLALVITPRYTSAGPWLLFIALFTTLYALFATVGLVGTVGSLTLARAEYLEASEPKVQAGSTRREDKTQPR